MINEENVVREGGLSAFKSRCEKFNVLKMSWRKATPKLWL